MFPSTNIQNIDNSKSIEIFPLNDKEHRTSKTNDGSAMTSNFSASSTSPMKDIYNDNISVTYEELVDGCTRVGLSLTTQVKIKQYIYIYIINLTILYNIFIKKKKKNY